jgi:glycosyltransferase involved in cell wall biosynthesis
MTATIAAATLHERIGGPAPRLSVVMPAYNEADNIEAAVADVVANVFRVVPDAELLVVDDGSRDATGAIATACSVREPRIRVIPQANAGHGPALVHGMRAARGDYCLLLDSDRQIGLQEFDETWRLREHNDAVLGVRRNRADPRHRLVLSAMLRGGMAAVLGIRSSDPNVPYKLVRRECALEAIRAMPAQPRIPSILLTVYLNRRGLAVVEQGVPHFARTAGETTLKFMRLARFCRAALGELWRFHRALGRGA